MNSDHRQSSVSGKTPFSAFRQVLITGHALPGKMRPLPIHPTVVNVPVPRTLTAFRAFFVAFDTTPGTLKAVVVCRA